MKDQHTAVLGGLTDREKDVTREGIPILSSLPLIGGLFGSQQSDATETELYVFLTPRVIRTDDDLDSAADSAGARTRDLRHNEIIPGSVVPDTTKHR